MPSVIVAGGGLAGMAAATALAGEGFRVELFESRAFLGGRATSYPLPGGATIDNCQHVLMPCFVNLLDFYRRLGVAGQIRFDRRFHFLEPGGRVSVLDGSPLSFLRLRFLNAADKLAVIRALVGLGRERTRRGDLHEISMLDWLREKRQTPRAIARFWGPVLVSALNEELDRVAANYGFQTLWLGFLASRDAAQLGVSLVPLHQLYDSLPGVTLHVGSPVERMQAGGVLSGGEWRHADYCICALPFEKALAVAPQLGLGPRLLEHSPITGIHLWFDRPVMDLPHATLLDRTIQWAFNKQDDGRYVQLVVSASRALLEMGRAEVIALAQRELAEFFPRAGAARLERAHVVKEVRATFSAQPGSDALRPPAETAVPNLFLAGDWTATGWPATMEGAVRGGYLAAEAVTRAAGRPRRFLV